MSLSAVIPWLKLQDVRASYQVNEIALDQQTDWLFDGSVIRHRLNRFFSIAGIEYSDGENVRAQPLIVQPEIGCLGWVTRRNGRGLEFLLQAKFEPGNCNGTQVAPTVQATKSNQDRIHGGAEVPFLNLFASGGPKPVVDLLQTEESDRFCRKLNRNVAVQIDGELAHSDQFRWCTVSTLKSLLAASHTVNTDARSVLTCLDWRLFHPSTPAHPGISQSLRDSIDLEPEPREVHDRLASARATNASVRPLSLSDLPGWTVTPSGLESAGGPFSIRYFQIHTRLREVPAWTQPLVVSHSAGMCLLAVSVDDGVARVYVRIRQAPGVLDGAEIGPSCQITPGQPPDALGPLDRLLLQSAQQGRLLAEADNSQEGSRFFKDCIRYRIALVDRRPLPETADALWVTLATLKHLIDEGRLVSNEMRSAVSFLLPLL